MQMHAVHLIALFISSSISPAVSAGEDPVRNNLISESGKWFHWVLWSAGIVVIGCIMEIFEASVEFLHWRWHRTNKPFQDDGGRWTVPAAIVGVVLVITGVAGEGFFESKQSVAETAIRQYDESHLAAAESRATTLDNQTQVLRIKADEDEKKLARITGPVQEVKVVDGVASPDPMLGNKLRIVLKRDVLIKFPTLPKGTALLWTLTIEQDDKGGHQFTTFPKQFMPGPQPGVANVLVLGPRSIAVMDLESDERGTMDLTWGGAALTNAAVNTVMPGK
jgi:hypothetical protein